MKDVDLLHERGFFEDIDRELARAVSRSLGETDGRVLLAVALASRAVMSRNLCVSLPRLVRRPRARRRRRGH
jgi:hypothetical protein